MITWCVAHTQPLKELIAKENLLNQGFEIYLPRFKKMRRHARKVEEIIVPLFPRYIFVGMDLETVAWRTVNNTRGISYLLMTTDHRPASVSDQIIQELKAQEQSDGILPIASLITFAKGDKVRILEGAFKDHIAVFETFDDGMRVQLLLSFLGRETRICLPNYAIEAA